MELIEGNGRFASVADVEPAAVVLNPLLAADYHNDYGVEAVPQTEDVSRAALSISRALGAGGWAGLAGSRPVRERPAPPTRTTQALPPSHTPSNPLQTPCPPDPAPRVSSSARRAACSRAPLT